MSCNNLICDFLAYHTYGQPKLSKPKLLKGLKPDWKQRVLGKPADVYFLKDCPIVVYFQKGYSTILILRRTQSRDGCRRQGCRFYTADGKVFDADWNAAINISNRYHPTPFRLPIDGQLNFVGRHRQQADSGLRKQDLQAAMSSA